MDTVNWSTSSELLGPSMAELQKGSAGVMVETVIRGVVDQAGANHNLLVDCEPGVCFKSRFSKETTDYIPLVEPITQMKVT